VESAVLAKIAELPEPDRAVAERLYAIITASAPALSPRTSCSAAARPPDLKAPERNEKARFRGFVKPSGRLEPPTPPYHGGAPARQPPETRLFAHNVATESGRVADHVRVTGLGQPQGRDRDRAVPVWIDHWTIRQHLATS
jgi:hypothetical protein